MNFSLIFVLCSALIATLVAEPHFFKKFSKKGGSFNRGGYARFPSYGYARSPSYGYAQAAPVVVHSAPSYYAPQQSYAPRPQPSYAQQSSYQARPSYGRQQVAFVSRPVFRQRPSSFKGHGKFFKKG